MNPVKGSYKSSVTVNVGENKETSKRTGTITVTCGNVSKSLEVTQASQTQPVDKYLEVDIRTISFTYRENTCIVNITSNVQWDITTSASWLTVIPVSGENNTQITVAADKNEQDDKRDATVNITGNGVPPVSISVS